MIIHSNFVLSVLVLALLRPNNAEEPEKELKESLSNFTLRFLRIASDIGEENVAFSPFCISLLLAVIQQGGKGNSAGEIDELLGFGSDNSRKYFRSLLQYVEGSLSKRIMHWGNRMYVRNDLEIDAEFQENIKINFMMTAEKANFTKNDLADDINSWISSVTDKRIKKAVNPASIRPDTILLLVSAVYFSDMWSNKFNVRDTEEDYFHTDDKTNVTVPFMIQKNRNTTIGEDDELGARWIRLGYSQVPSLSMLLILPTKRFSLDNLLRNMTEKHILHMMRENRTNMTTISIPKFKISGKILLPDYLKKLGVIDIFTDYANLSGITKSDECIQISDMIHDCRIEVNEKGTTAAAVAAAKFQFLSGSMDYPENAIFKADEPFLFIIFDKTIEMPLFVGKVSNPRSSSTEEEDGEKPREKVFT